MINLKESITRPLIILIMFFILKLTFVLFLNKNVVITVHDYLDATHSWLKILKDSKQFFVSSKESTIMLDGLPRAFLPSERNVYSLLHLIFPSLLAHWANYFIKIIIGTFCMFKLLSYLWPNHDRGILLIISYTYALLPGFEPLYLAQALLPGLVLAYLKIMQHRELKFFVLIALYPFFSSFAIYGILVIGFVMLMTILSLVQRKNILMHLAILTVFIVLSYIAEYRLFEVMLFSDTATIKSEINLVKSFFPRKFLSLLIRGDLHSQSQHVFIMFLSGITWIFARKSDVIGDIEKILLSSIVFLVFISSIYYASDLAPVIGRVIPQLKGWNWARLMWFVPLIWYILFASILGRDHYIFSRMKYCLAWFQLIIVFSIPSYGNDVRNSILRVVGFNDDLTYREFYSEDLFSELKDTIRYSGEKSMALGFHPSILHYNGITSVDGYLSSYDLERKHRFAALLGDCFQNSPVGYDYFHNWGGRAYYLNDEVSYQPMRSYNEVLHEPCLNWKIARSINLKYIFSLRELDTLNTPLDLINVYSEEESPYRIKLYKIDNN